MILKVKPPVEVLFVAKLNPVTTDDDLELIFSRFGPIKECAIIRDFKTGGWVGGWAAGLACRTLEKRRFLNLFSNLL